MLPQLRKLEQAFPNDLVIIGVHAGKFIAERVTENIRQATLRLDVHHPVVNDRQFRTWRAYAVDAWPTITLISAEGRVVAQQAGEIPAEAILPVIERLIEEARSAGIPRPGEPAVHSSWEQTPAGGSGLRFPSKLAIAGARICIADTGNHRIVLAHFEHGGATAKVERVIGRERGFVDGRSDDARFEDPLGVCFASDGTIYVADEGNHAIRAVGEDGIVRTVAGTGAQARRFPGPGGQAAAKTELPLNSPWDVIEIDGVLYVAMAGWHQLWRVDPNTGAAAPWVGSGAEGLVDGPPDSAALAQPSGLARVRERLYFADAESSAIRWADLGSGVVHTVVGTGLFDFGDRDGAGDDVRLQHPLAVAADTGVLYVADTYNGLVKRLDPGTREAARLEASAGELWEPGGLAVADGRLYIVDTNHHRIAFLDDAGAMQTLTLAW